MSFESSKFLCDPKFTYPTFFLSELIAQSQLTSQFPSLDLSCLVPRPHYSAQPMRFGSRGPRGFCRLGYVTEMRWLRRPGKLPYRDWAKKFQHPVPPYLLSSVLQPGTVGDELLGSRDSCPCCCYQLEWNVHQLASHKQWEPLYTKWGPMCQTVLSQWALW